MNLSPESFYKGSVYSDSESIETAVRRMETEGADIIDVGAASSAPVNIYATSPISGELEASRIEEAFPRIRQLTELPISIDTTSSRVARIALDLGADMVNDVSGLRDDPEMALLIADRGVPVVIMSRCSPPCHSLNQALEALCESIRIAGDAGIHDDRIIVDPGIGFGKPAAVDLDLVKSLGSFKMLGYPLLVGLSRKAFLGSIACSSSPDERLTETIAATAISVAYGADIVRSHDVAEARKAVRVGAALATHSHLTSGSVELVDALDEQEASVLLKRIGVSPEVVPALSKKCSTLNVLVSGVTPSAGVVMKQEMLAVGGDAAYHHGTIDHSVDCTDVLVMGNRLQLSKLAKRLLKMTYFGLDRIGREIADVLDVHIQK
ncbi:MAG: dihydropteroate synthase [Candidatus Thorarchaeota archaeon]